MTTVERFQTVSDYWHGMVVPDYDDSMNNPSDLRVALHTAISLFHMHDWVFSQHNASIPCTFTFLNSSGDRRNVSSAASFANALQEIEQNFALIRNIANAAKHLQLSYIGSHPDAPSNAANTSSLSDSGGASGVFFCIPQVMLEGASGHLRFGTIAKSVFEMWLNLNKQHKWWSSP